MLPHVQVPTRIGLPDCDPRLMFAFALMPEIGKLLVIFGVLLVVVGVLLWSGFGAGWLGRLPGDIRVQRGNFSFYFPIVTCIILSIVLSLLFALFRR
jgi:hypothetical protein